MKNDGERRAKSQRRIIIGLEIETEIEARM